MAAFVSIFTAREVVSLNSSEIKMFYFPFFKKKYNSWV